MIAIRKRVRRDSSTAEDEAPPQLLCLLLEVEQMTEMNARLERIGAHVERIDARVCCMARGGPSRAPPAGDALGPFPVAMRTRAMHLLDLPAEMLVAIATQLAEDDSSDAAAKGHLHVLQLAHANGHWAVRTCSSAAWGSLCCRH
jgi:hypothetical protein